MRFGESFSKKKQFAPKGQEHPTSAPTGRVHDKNVQIEDDPKTSEDEFVPRMDEENYQIMLAEIRAAGGDKIQAELQRQLDEWLKANPNWQNP